jgi:hypothetical protein
MWSYLWENQRNSIYLSITEYGSANFTDNCGLIFSITYTWSGLQLWSEYDVQGVYKVDCACTFVFLISQMSSESAESKGAFPPSDFPVGFTDILSVTHSKILKSGTFLPYLTETLSQTKVISDRVSVTDFSTSSQDSGYRFFSQSFPSVFPLLSVGTMATCEGCCHLTGAMLNLAAEAADRARIGPAWNRLEIEEVLPIFRISYTFILHTYFFERHFGKL